MELLPHDKRFKIPGKSNKIVCSIITIVASRSRTRTKCTLMPVGKPIYITKIGIILCAQSTCHAAYVIIKYSFLRCRSNAHAKVAKYMSW